MIRDPKELDRQITQINNILDSINKTLNGIQNQLNLNNSDISKLQSQTNSNNIPFNKQPAITQPTGGATIDAQSRTAINSIITSLKKLGLTN